MNVEEAERVLGVCVPERRDTRGASLLALALWKDTTLTAAYRTAMRQAHPDRGGTTESAQRVNEARGVLLGTGVEDMPVPAPERQLGSQERDAIIEMLADTAGDNDSGELVDALWKMALDD